MKAVKGVCSADRLRLTTRNGNDVLPDLLKPYDGNGNDRINRRGRQVVNRRKTHCDEWNECAGEWPTIFSPLFCVLCPSFDNVLLLS
jgi:hypothetical protein